ncbi:transglutaminase TgpA family protein [Amycolatopsis taiwanensis]|uniref:transglutaminase TgpA family protein n=1 Tax=Amycolatopsis taiwanensis TaxID=342230 RepID=UPI0004AEB959|nr:transglutaminaseTgpA domain-containing protein [Amycolatopsis taiwanensis]
MTLNRPAVAGVLAATAVAGLLFAPVFGLVPVLVPVLVVVLVGYGWVELSARWPGLLPWRPVLVALTGLLGLTEAVLFATTAAGLPTVATLRALESGLTRSWLLTLQSTLPARPDAEQLLFVPLAVLLAVAVSLELLLRWRKPLLALLPSLAVAGLSQAYFALPGVSALLAAVAYLAPAGLLMRAERTVRSTDRPARRPTGAGVLLAVLTVIAVLAGAVALGSLDPAGRAPYRLADSHPAPPPQNQLTNPLDEIGARLSDPGEEVFRYRSDTAVDRWRLITLDGFDGVNWTADTRLQRMGARLHGVAGAAENTADVRVGEESGPWLPSQANPVAVDGVASLVDQSAGTLLLDQPVASSYRLTWSAPEVDSARLAAAPVDTQAAGGLGDLGVVPTEISALATDALHGLRPTFQAALQLERYLSEHYQVAVGDDLPTGHGWPQLQQFLLDTKRGTSEQFAAAYVALARIVGIPARLVVGYRGSSEVQDGFHIVRNRDVVAWPEVAVTGVGWVPLDPVRNAVQAGQAQSGLAKAAAQARAQLPPENKLSPPQLPPGGQDDAAGATTGMGSWLWWTVGAVGLALIVARLAGVPLAKAVRALRRRRRQGVLGAWAEVRDRLTAHGVPYRIGMTPRDLADAAHSTLGGRIREPMGRLAQVLDAALWSGAPVPDGAAGHAWEEVRAVRRSLAGRPLGARLRAALEARTLRRQ